MNRRTALAALAVVLGSSLTVEAKKSGTLTVHLKNGSTVNLEFILNPPPDLVAQIRIDPVALVDNGAFILHPG